MLKEEWEALKVAGVYELVYGCGCKFAIYKKSKLVKLCNKHFNEFHDLPFDVLVKAVLQYTKAK
jgi:hypothetical protein